MAETSTSALVKFLNAKNGYKLILHGCTCCLNYYMQHVHQNVLIFIEKDDSVIDWCESVYYTYMFAGH